MEYNRDGINKLKSALGDIPRSIKTFASSIGDAFKNTPDVKGAAVTLGSGVAKIGNNIFDRSAGSAVNGFNKMARDPLGQAVLLAATAYLSFKGIRSWITGRKNKQALEEMRTRNDQMEMGMAGSRDRSAYGSFNNDVGASHVAGLGQRAQEQTAGATR